MMGVKALSERISTSYPMPVTPKKNSDKVGNSSHICQNTAN